MWLGRGHKDVGKRWPKTGVPGGWGRGGPGQGDPVVCGGGSLVHLGCYNTIDWVAHKQQNLISVLETGKSKIMVLQIPYLEPVWEERRSCLAPGPCQAEANDKSAPCPASGEPSVHSPPAGCLVPTADSAPGCGLQSPCPPGPSHPHGSPSRAQSKRQAPHSEGHVGASHPRTRTRREPWA